MPKSALLLLSVVLTGCGHMTPYTEHPLGYVELYEAAPGGSQLRLQYKVQLYEPFPTRDYLDEHWIVLSSGTSGTYLLAQCPPGFRNRFGFEPRGMIGTIEIDASVVRLALRAPGAAANDLPYKFNGEWKLVRVSGPIPSPAVAHARDCVHAL
jgi:hypothetical protein